MAGNVVARFFNQARDIALGERSDFVFDPIELLEIANDPGSAAEFEATYRSLNDQTLKIRVKAYLRRFADELEREEGRLKRKSGWFSSVGVQFNIAVSAAGIAAIAGSLVAGVAVWPAAVLLGSGLFGMIYAKTVESSLDRKAEDRRFEARRIREIIE